MPFMHSRQECSITLLVIVCFIIVLIPAPVTGEPSGDALTQGDSFAINITGSPGTPYCIWLTRTSSMKGKPGDQPPVIVAFQNEIKEGSS
jgi:hypothetical protein